MVIEVTLIPRQYTEEDHSNFYTKSKRARKMGLNVDENRTSLFNGIVNEGNTCYMNSMLQTLFSLTSFRKAIYQSEPSKDEVMLALQRIFYNLQMGKESVRTPELLQSFGWTKE
jgi:uncharacterized UBP type Zn finger protein